MNQLAIDFQAARAQGEIAAGRCIVKAERNDPEFSAKAEQAILDHLRVVGQASGEVLTDVAIAHGARPHDARAFGAVFKSLARRGLIRTVGYCMRSKGHGTAGGRVWGIAC
jgi:hypothetical protein